MTDAAVVPLDEIQWNSPQAIAFYGGISAENGLSLAPQVHTYHLLTLPVHLYFMNSPFCERTSNNKILESQSQFNQQLNDDLRDRARMEARLERMNGVEYRVVDGPLHTTPEMNPVWVFRKQNREKHAGQDDKLTILGTYFAIGENIYQAPSLHDIVRCRMVSKCYPNGCQPLLTSTDVCYQPTKQILRHGRLNAILLPFPRPQLPPLCPKTQRAPRPRIHKNQSHQLPNTRHCFPGAFFVSAKREKYTGGK